MSEAALHAQSAENPQIGFSLEAAKGERWQTDLDSFNARAKQLGVTVISADAAGDDDLQLRQVQAMIKAGIKVLVLLPHDTTKASKMVDRAKAAHVKVISYDRLVLNSDVDLYISFDPVEIGRMQAESLLKLAPQGNYVIIAGSPNDANAKILHDAQLRVLQPYLDRGDIKVIADWYTKEWDPAQAYVHMLDAIDVSQGNITAVLASNDGLAGGAIQALQDRKLGGKVFVSGQDADLMAIIRIVENTQSMTIYKSITGQAALAADEAAHLARGETTDEDRTVYNGKKKVPAILLRGVIVTNENLRTTVIKDGFQKIDSINAGLPEEKRLPN
ncbi:MAG: sugar ABC transporter substrate-binding protein [Candidatus Sulfotelmatobacter sp.]